MKKIKGYLIGKKLSNYHSMEIYTKLSKRIEYENKEIKTSDNFLSFVSKRKFDYLNITAPYKEIVRSILDKESELVKEIGVCNLVVNRNGILSGYNTDAYGFRKLLELHNINVKNKKILILGNGCTSKTIKYVLTKLEAARIEVACRNIRSEGEALFKDAKRDAEIIINATPVGKNISDSKLINLEEYDNLEYFIDILSYPYRTALMIDALDKGCGAFNGYDMLFNQAIQAYSLATRKIGISYALKHLRKELLLNHVNIVLTGLPTSGKSKLGKEFDEIMNDEHSHCYIDTDKFIENAIGSTISEYVEKEGIKNFRAIEKYSIKLLKDTVATIISTGGGAIIDKENYYNLARNGFIVYLYKNNFDDFKDDGTRPLVKTKEDLINLYKERHPIYSKRADLTISSDSDANSVIGEAIDAITGY